MSINVTVTGNPVSVHKGRMVTASPNHSKKEFERRRLIRISQVRQQSKNIAEDIRNRVRQEKLKQAEEIEKEGQKKLKQWQAKKLLKLQNQYHEALRFIGSGHKEAKLVEDEVEKLSEKKESSHKLAYERGLIAKKRLREEKDKSNHGSRVLFQRKKLQRHDDKRSQILSSIRRSAASLKRRKFETEKLSETEVSGIVTDSDSEYENYEEEETLRTTNGNINLHEPSYQPLDNLKEPEPIQIDDSKEETEQNKQKTSEDINPSKFKVSDRDEQLLRELRQQRDTRISDRIRQRCMYQQNQPDPCDSLYRSCPTYTKDTLPVPPCTITKSPNFIRNVPTSIVPPKQQNIYACSCCRRTPVFREAADYSPCHCTYVSPKMQKPGISDINQIRCSEFTDEEDTRNQKFVNSLRSKTPNIRPEIPIKPKVTLRSVKSPTKTPFSHKIAQHLQNSTGRSKFLSSNVEKIHKDNLISSPVISTRNDFFERMKQRDREALQRGQKALEREKLQREYNELMKKLPALQKLERMYEMSKDKPEYHMTEERLREQEKKKQDVLDNAYEKLFPDRRPPTITIPVKDNAKNIINAKEKSLKPDSLDLNLNCLDSGKSKKLYTEGEVEALLKEGTSHTGNKLRTDQLKVVLHKLRKQKEELLKEIQNLPNESKLNDILPLTDNSKKNPIPQNENLSTTSSDMSITSQNSSSEIPANIIQKKKKVHHVSVKKAGHMNATKSDNTNMRKTSIKISANSNIQSCSSFETLEDANEKALYKQTKTIQSAQKSDLKFKTSIKETKIATTQTPTRKRGKEKESTNLNKESASTKKPEKEKYRASKESHAVQTSSKTVNKEIHQEKKKIPLQTKGPPPPSPASPLKIHKKAETKTVSNAAASISTTKPQKQMGISEITNAPSTSPNSLAFVVQPNKKTTNEVGDKGKFLSCQCEKETSSKKTSELCEIVIKIKDGKSSEIFVNDIKDTTNNKAKSLVVEKPSSIKISTKKRKDQKLKQRLQEVSDAIADDCCQNVESSKPHSWHEKFSKNNSTSSTSYMSPPVLSNKSKNHSKAPSNFCSSFDKKAPKLNLADIVSPPTKLPVESQRILTEVKRLLSMSRLSIDELGVSSVSSVTTPSQSIIDLESNKVHTTRTQVSTNVKSTEHSVISSDVQSQPGIPNLSVLTFSSDNKTLVASELDSTSEQYPDILEKYAKIAEQCSQRISNLSAMIERVREEKKRMLESPSLLNTNDSSTRYMDPPSPKKHKHQSSLKEENKSNSSGSSGGNILDIDLSLANKLKGLTKEEIEKYLNTSELHDLTLTDYNNIEEDLANRLKALKESHVLPIHQTSEQSLKKPEDRTGTAFTPVLMDIPKLPPLAASSNNGKHKKPPPSKGILVARKLIDFPVPHELSTIPEQDSQTRLEYSIKEKSPKTSEREHSVVEGRTIVTNIEDLICVIDQGDGNIKSTSDIREVTLKSTLKETEKIKDALNLSENSLASTNTSSDEKIEMFRIEAMLRSIGMDWAIATLRKTQEALALTSSSSSIDLKSSSNIKQISDSDIKKYLAKPIMQKISSSTLRSDASPGSLNESHELSEIQNDEFKNQQTSTPVNRSREWNRQRDTDLPSAVESEKDFFSFLEPSAE